MAHPVYFVFISAILICWTDPVYLKRKGKARKGNRKKRVNVKNKTKKTHNMYLYEEQTKRENQLGQQGT